jgi:protein subunit release factor B
MATFPVSEGKARDLASRMAALGLKDSDLDESFVRSQGAGGQHVNKVSTCVVLRHRASGVEVRCQRERSQALNRFLARRLLVERLEAMRHGREAKAVAAREKLRRQKRRRSRRSKQKMLDAKRLHGEKKAMRARPQGNGD